MTIESMNRIQALLPEMGVGLLRRIPLEAVDYRLFIYRSSETNNIQHCIYCLFYSRGVQIAQIVVLGKSILDTMERADLYLTNFPVSVPIGTFEEKKQWGLYNPFKDSLYSKFLCKTYRIDKRDFESYLTNLFKPE